MTLFDDAMTPLQEKYEAQLDTWVNVFSEYDLRILDKVLETVKAERNSGITVYPEANDILRIYRELSIKDIKVVILGQDPYHDGNANGVAFACKNKMSKSLEQIINAIMLNFPDTPVSVDSDKSLQHLVVQGVFLLNTVLTVRRGHPNSHENIGWQAFTRATIQAIARRHSGIIWMLWGKYAQEYETVIKQATYNSESQFILKAEHPAAAARNNRIWKTTAFKEANDILTTFNNKPIRWL